MPDKNFYYRLNNFLILIVIVFVGFVLYSKFQVVHSQNSNTPSTTNTAKSYVINRELKADINPSDFTAYFKSDGYSGEPSDSQKSKFYVSDTTAGKTGGNAGALELIDTPLKFSLVKAESKAILPGTTYYSTLCKPTAAKDCVCVEKGAEGDDAENRRKCFQSVTDLSAWQVLTQSSIVLQDQQYKVTSTNDPLSNFIGAIKLALNNMTNAIVKSIGVPDQSRKAVGTIQFWGDDNYQQFVKMSAGGSDKKVVVLVAEASIETSANNIDQGLFSAGFSPGINSNIQNKYKQANVVSVALKCTGSADSLGLIPSGDKSPICGPAQIFDPYSTLDTSNVTSTNTQPSSLLSNIFTSIGKIADAFMQAINQNNPSFQQKQKRLSAQVAIRPIDESTKFSVKYSLCDAIDQDTLDDGSKAKKFNFENYPNPYAYGSNDKCASEFIIAGGAREPNPEYNSTKNQNCQKYNSLKSSNPKITRCFTGVSKFVTDQSAKKCVDQYIKDGTGCDEFSVEEGGLNLTQVEKSFPIGLGSYFQNSTLQALDPASTKGPFVNYLSPYFCGKLNLSYKLTPGADYIYDAGTANGNSGKIRDSANKFIEADFVNQYCILGASFSEFSYAMSQMAGNNFSTTNTNGIINMPKESLTCDKKETAFYGAVPIKTNADYPGSQPIYIADDNTRDGNITNDEVAVFQGYNAYPLTDILKDPLLKGKKLVKYGNLDMQAIIDTTSTSPKYIVLSASSDNKSMDLLLCKFPSNTTNYSENAERSLCVLVDSGPFIFANTTGIVRNSINMKRGGSKSVDTITIVYAQDADKPFKYRYIDIVDDNEIGNTKGYTLNIKPSTPNGQTISEQIDKSTFVSDAFSFHNGFTMNASGKQIGNGQIAVSGLAGTNKGIDSISASILDPYAGANTVFVQDAKGEQIIDIKRSANERYTDNLCSNGSTNYCNVLTSLGYVRSTKVISDPRTGLVNIAAISKGFGVIFTVDFLNVGNKITPRVFGYKSTTTRFTDSFDEISAIQIAPSGEIQMFLARSGIFLNLFDVGSAINSSVINETIQRNIQKDCGTNCLLTMEKEFNPTNFTTDCTGYDGQAACGFTKLGKIGAPIVWIFNYTSTGKIRAWYTQKNLDKTLLQSPDILYSFSPVYDNVKTDAGPSNEYSDIYIPVAGQIKLDNKTVNGPVGTPIRFFNYSTGGLILGRELEFVSGNVRENISPDNSENFPAYDSDRLFEKLDCINTYNTRVSGIDLYYSNTGLVQVNINPSASLSTPIHPVTDTNGASTNGSNSNSGLYCEEKWCVTDDFKLANNPSFGKESSNEPAAVAMRAKIVDMLSASHRNIPRSKYVDAVNFMCVQADKYLEPCTILAALWIQESSGAFYEFSNGSFNCGDYPTLYDQIDCAAQTVYKKYNTYLKGDKTITGPSDKIGKPYLTNPNRGGGSCTAATAFSYIFQKYTPTDPRINNDNQCNLGLVKRVGDGQVNYCQKGTILPNSASRINGVSSLPAVWPEAYATRMNIQTALLTLGETRLGNLRSDKCYPSNAASTPSNPSNNTDIDTVLKQYDMTKTQKVGEMKIDLSKWGQDDAAGNIYMLMNVNIKQAQSDWNSLDKSSRNNFDITKYADGKGIQGAYIVKPGTTWSYNDSYGNPSGDFIEATVVPQIAKTKAPWNPAKYDYSSANRCRSTVNGKSIVNTGCGWCEMGTTFRLAAERVEGTDKNSNQTNTLSQKTFSGAATVGASTSYGTGKGWMGDINHWSHSSVSSNTYNSLVPNGVKGLPIDEVSKYVSIVTNPGNSSGLNDGDLLLRNPYDTASNIDMIITVQLSTSGIITVQVMFGVKK